MNRSLRLLVMFLVSILILTTAVFAGGDKEQPGKAGVTLNILMEDVPDTTAIEKLLPEFTAETGINVTLEKVVYTVMHEKLVPQLMAKEGKGSYDVLEVDNYWVGEFMQAKWILPLDQYLKNSPDILMTNYIDSVEKMFNITDVTYFIPMWTYPMGLVYRTDIVNNADFKKYYEEKAGKKFMFPPADLNSVVEMIKIANSFTPSDVYGIAMQGAKIDPIAMELFNFIIASGGDLYDRDTWKASMNTPEGKQAITLYKDLLLNAAQPGASGANFDDAFNVFGQGNAVFAVTYNFLMSWLLDPKNSRVADKVDFVALPGGGLLGGWGWAIPASTPHPDEAWQFLKWVEQKKIQKARGMGGGMPAVKWVYQDEEFIQAWPFQKAAYDSIATAVPVPVLSQSTSMIEILGEYASQAMTGDISIQEAVTTMDTELNKILEGDSLIELQK